MFERFATKVLIALACCLLLALPVSTALAQEGVWEGTKKAVEQGAQGVKKGAQETVDKTEDVGEAVGKGIKKGAQETVDKTEDVGEAVGKGIKKGAEEAVDKTEDVGEAVGKGVKDVFTDDDSDTESLQRSKPGTTDSGTESTAPVTSQRETETMKGQVPNTTERVNRQLPKTSGEGAWFALIGALSLLGAVALKLARRLPNS